MSWTFSCVFIKFFFLLQSNVKSLADTTHRLLITGLHEVCLFMTHCQINLMSISHWTATAGNKLWKPFKRESLCFKTFGRFVHLVAQCYSCTFKTLKTFFTHKTIRVVADILDPSHCIFSESKYKGLVRWLWEDLATCKTKLWLIGKKLNSIKTETMLQHVVI